VVLRAAVQEHGMIYHLEGVTKKGKQRIKEHGTKWLVVEKRKGTFGDVLLRSVETNDIRWLTDDFFVERIEDERTQT